MLRLSRKKIFFRVLLLFWALWIFFAIYKLSDSSNLAVLYFIYMVLGTAVLALNSKDILSPRSFIIVGTFYSFGLNIPFFSGTELIEDLMISDKTLSDILIIVIVVQLSFLLGSFVPLNKQLPLRKLTGNHLRGRKVSYRWAITIAGIVLFAALFRITFSLGQAGKQPTIPFAGYLQFIFYDGVLVGCLWFLAQSLRQKRIFIFVALGLLVSVALTQALLGWRGGIFHILVVSGSVFWYQFKTKRSDKTFSLAWLAIPILLAGSLIEVGNKVRAKNLGGEAEYGTTISGFVTRIAMRSQGTSRLAGVVDHFEGLSLTNSFKIFYLMKTRQTTTTYIDRVVHGVDLRVQSHSVGTSGPGGPYTGMGLLGVFLAYLILGCIYQAVYKEMFRPGKYNNNVMVIVYYSMLLYIMLQFTSENLNVLIVKKMIAATAMVYACRIIVSKR